MKTITIHKAKTTRLVPVCNFRGERKPGRLKGKFEVGQEFFEPLPLEELDLWWK
jgi:hypothetical protein